jgi:hypothetical protein
MIINFELRMWNVELVGFADYIIMNYSIKIIIQYLFPLVIGTSSLRSLTEWMLSAKLRGAIISLAYTDAPVSLTASAQSMTYG